jgi:hypothetical protein
MVEARRPSFGIMTANPNLGRKINAAIFTLSNNPMNLGRYDSQCPFHLHLCDGGIDPSERIENQRESAAAAQIGGATVAGLQPRSVGCHIQTTV